MHILANHKTYHNVRELRNEQPKFSISGNQIRTQLCHLETGRRRRRKNSTPAKKGTASYGTRQLSHCAVESTA